MSPGDLDGDGYSELFVAEISYEKRVFVFKGGNPPDTESDMYITNGRSNFKWLNDINGDGLADLMHDRGEIWFGDSNFFSKQNPDMIFSESSDTFYNYGYSYSSGDVNDNGQSDIVISAQGKISPYAGRFYIYHGGLMIDTIVDEVINIRPTIAGYNNFFWGLGL